MEQYKIMDEPQISPLSKMATNPMWPLLAVMIASPIYGWVWFILNSLAIGSPSKIKEILTAIAGMVFISFFYIYLGELKHDTGSVYFEYIDYIRLAGVIVSVSISYYLFVLQNQPFQLYEYFGGQTMSGIPGLVLGFILGKKIQLFVMVIITGGFV